MKRKAVVSLQTPRKQGKVGDADIESPNSKKSSLDQLNLPFILWGNSQKVQVAGVCRSVPLVCDRSNRFPKPLVGETTSDIEHPSPIDSTSMLACAICINVYVSYAC